MFASGAIIPFRQPKEGCTLGGTYGRSICPVKTLQTFIERTEQLRTKLPIDHKLFFLAYLVDEEKVCSVRETTVAN